MALLLKNLSLLVAWEALITLLLAVLLCPQEG